MFEEPSKSFNSYELEEITKSNQESLKKRKNYFMEDSTKRNTEIPDYIFFNRPNYSHITLKNFGDKHNLMQHLEREERIKFKKQRNKFFNRMDNRYRYFDDYYLKNQINKEYYNNGVKKEFEINNRFMKMMFLKRSTKNKNQSTSNFKSNNAINNFSNKQHHHDNSENQIYSISDKKLNNPEKNIFLEEECNGIEDIHLAFDKQASTKLKKLINHSDGKRIRNYRNIFDLRMFTEENNTLLIKNEEEKISKEMPRFQIFNKRKNLNNDSSELEQNKIKDISLKEVEFNSKNKSFKNKNPDLCNLTIQKNYNLQKTYDINIKNLNINDNSNLIYKYPTRLDNRETREYDYSDNLHDSMSRKINHVSKNVKVSNNSNIQNKAQIFQKMNQVKKNNSNSSLNFNYSPNKDEGIDSRTSINNNISKYDLTLRNGYFYKFENQIRDSDSDDSYVALDSKKNNFDICQLNQKKYINNYNYKKKRNSQISSRLENIDDRLNKVRCKKERRNHNTSNYFSNKVLGDNKINSSVEESEDKISNHSGYESIDYDKNNINDLSLKNNMKQNFKFHKIKSSVMFNRDLLNLSDTSSSEVLCLNEKPYEVYNNNIKSNKKNYIFRKKEKRELMLIDLISDNSDDENDDFKSISEINNHKPAKNYFSSSLNQIKNDIKIQNLKNINGIKDWPNSERSKVKLMEKQSYDDSIPIKNKVIKTEEKQPMTAINCFQSTNFLKFQDDYCYDLYIPKKKNFQKIQTNKKEKMTNDYGYLKDLKKQSISEENISKDFNKNNVCSFKKNESIFDLEIDSDIKINKFSDNCWNKERDDFSNQTSKPTDTEFINLIEEDFIEERNKNPITNNEKYKIQIISPNHNTNKVLNSTSKQKQEKKTDVFSIDNFIQTKDRIISRKPIDKKLLELDFIPFKKSFSDIENNNGECHYKRSSSKVKYFDVKSPTRYFDYGELSEEVQENHRFDNYDNFDEENLFADDLIESRRNRILNIQNNYLTNRPKNGETNSKSNIFRENFYNRSPPEHESESKSDKLDEEFLLNNKNIYTVKSDRENRRRRRTHSKCEDFNLGNTNCYSSEVTPLIRKKNEISTKKCLRCNKNKHTNTGYCLEIIHSKCIKCQNLNHNAENCLINRSYYQSESRGDSQNKPKNVICMICGKFGHTFCPMELKVFEDFYVNDDSADNISEGEKSAESNNLFGGINEEASEDKCEICYANHNTLDCKFPQNAFREINNSTSFLFEHKKRIAYRESFSGNPDLIVTGSSKLFSDKNFFYSPEDSDCNL